jgi:hypothetical protein
MAVFIATGPEYATAADGQPAGWQNIVQSKVSGITIVEVRGIGRGIALLIRVDAAVPFVGPGRNATVIGPAGSEYLPDCGLQRVSVTGIRVKVPGDDERGPGADSTAHTVVIDDESSPFRPGVFQPEPNLVMVAAAVAVLRPVEYGWRRVVGQQMKFPAANLEHQVPVAL